jgi:hypothetical protein
MQFRISVPNRILDEDTINAALETSTRANEALARHGLLPDLGAALAAGARWAPEPWPFEEFALAHTVAGRKVGDCDDYAAWLAGQLRAAGDTRARAFVYRTGPSRWHAVVQDGRGRVLDPSVWAGMPTRKGKPPGGRVGPPTIPLVSAGRSAICVVPDKKRRQWYARADLPMGDGMHLAAWSRQQHPQHALTEAIGTYGWLAEGLHGASIGEVGDWGFGDILEVAVPAAAMALGVPAPVAAAMGPMAKGVYESQASGNSGGIPEGLPPAFYEAYNNALAEEMAKRGISPSGEASVATQNTVQTGPVQSPFPQPSPAPAPTGAPATYSREDALAGKAGPAAQAAAMQAQAAELQAQQAQQPAKPPAPAQTFAKPLSDPAPHGFPPGAKSFEIPGPRGRGLGRVVYSPNGGPVIIEF